MVVGARAQAARSCLIITAAAVAAYEMSNRAEQQLPVRVPCQCMQRFASQFSAPAARVLTPLSPRAAPPRIDNPAYKGKWVAPDIDNPEYKADDKLYLIKDSKYVGFELWQVKAGSIFDNIIVTDDIAEAKKLAEETWAKNKAGEKEMMDNIKKVRAHAGLAAAAEGGGSGWRLLRLRGRARLDAGSSCGVAFLPIWRSGGRVVLVCEGGGPCACMAAVALALPHT